jgi:hypothetical protein
VGDRRLGNADRVLALARLVAAREGGCVHSCAGRAADREQLREGLDVVDRREEE